MVENKDWGILISLNELPVTTRNTQLLLIAPCRYVHGLAKAPRICADHEP